MSLKIILHAPTPAALGRARNNAINVMREAPDAQVRIVVNAQAVAAVLDAAEEEMDALTWLCPVTLLRTNRVSRAPLQVLSGAAVLEVARMQQAGWVYIRA